MFYFYRILKFYAFIFHIILLYCAGDCWPSHKRNYDAINPMITASFYDRLKANLAPVLQKTIDLSTPLEKSSPLTYLKRFKKSANHRTGSGKNLVPRNSHAAFRQSQDKRSSLVNKKVLPPISVFENNAIFLPHRGNQSVSTVSDQENDYDYGDQDLPDIEEPPAHIFEYNRANNTNKKFGKVALKPNSFLSHPLASAGKFGNKYEKCKKHLGPLVEKGSDMEKPSKLQEKLLVPYVKLTSQGQAEKAAITSDSKGSAPVESLPHYSSLYDQFKKRLLDFSSELGIDAGLKNDDNNVNDFILSSDSKASLTDGKKNLKIPEDLSIAFKKAQQLVDHLEKRALSNSNKRQNSAIYETKKIQKQKKKRKRSSLHYQNEENSNVAKCLVNPDVDFWLEQRGFLNRKSKEEDTLRKLNIDTDYNSKRCDPFINGYVDGGCDYNDILKPMSILKNSKKPIEIKKRFFRGLDDMGNNYLPDITRGTDGSQYNDKFFPNVLVQSIPTPLGSTSKLSARSLLEDVAQKLNLSTLDAAKKIVAIQDLNLTTLKEDPTLHNTLQEYIENSVIGSSQAQLLKAPNQHQNFMTKAQHHESPADIAIETRSNLPLSDCLIMSSPQNDDCALKQAIMQAKPNEIVTTGKKNDDLCNSNKDDLTDEQVAKILEKLLAKLEEIEVEKNETGTKTTQTFLMDDTPCKLTGSWFSTAMGLRFDLNVSNSTENDIEPEAKRYGLKVKVRECMPPRPHDIIDTKWPFTGSTIKEIGGPFYLYTQKKSDNILATFVGYCRTCGNIDTIFGTWSFSLPAKCCRDTPASFQTKNDAMHRYALEDKQRERYKDILFKNSIFAV